MVLIGGIENMCARCTWLRVATALLGVVLTLVMSKPSLADEGGAAMYLSGANGSLAAVPGEPGLSVVYVYYHQKASFGLPSVGYTSERSDVGYAVPSYAFATPVLGGQLSLGVASWFGKSSASIAGTLTATVGPFAATRSGLLADSLTSYGDVVPTATLRWNQGVNNYMVYVTGDIPAGDYDPARLANLGIGHGTIDAGGAYTYLNPASGNEFSATAGFTYNFKNPDTQYRNGIDFHFDWGAAHFVSKQVFIGVAGYAYQQITDDSGQNPLLGGFRSSVLGVGPQIGYIFPLGDMQGFLGLRAYGDFDAANRAPGWSTWLTFAVSPAEPAVAKPVRQMFTK